MVAPAHRLSQLPPYPFAVLGERLRQMQKAGIDVIRLDIGSPDLPPAEPVINKLYESAQKPNNHGYSGYSGLPSFRQAVAEYYQRRFGVSLNPDTEVLPVLGSKEGIVNLSLAYLDRGDVSLVPDISYPSYAMGAILAGAQVQWLQCDSQNHFLPILESIPTDILAKSKILWINYPNNPTGEVVNLDYYEQILEFCQRYDIMLASDNPYVETTFDSFVAPSPLQIPSAKAHTIEFISLSKMYNMAGWRLGAAVGSAEIIKNLLTIKSNVDSGHFIPIYDAGTFALKETSKEWLATLNQTYARRRDKILATLQHIGLVANKPSATLYIWAKPLHLSATDYVEQALTEAHVSMAHGMTYGPGGRDYLRISLSVADARIDEALQRLTDWYAKR